MLKNFRTYQLAVTLYRQICAMQLPADLRDQARRAGASAVLNSAEGSGRWTRKDQAKFFDIAFASTKEVQACLDLNGDEHAPAVATADILAAHLFRLKQHCRRN
jgi:four helix bundle protein